MREFKFRGLSAKGLMVYGYLALDKEGSTMYWKDYSQRICWYPESGGQTNAPVKNGTVGQFTGLKDKNGVEIYDGDILKVTSFVTTELVVVINFMGNSCYAFPPLGDAPTGTPIYPTLLAMRKEVIGNIHENPELLEVSK